MSIYRRVLRYYQPFWGQTILGLFLSLVGIGLNLLKPWPFKIIVDDFLRPTPSARGDWRTWVPLLCLALVVIQLAWGIINWITNYLFVKIGLQALLKLRTDLYAYLQSLSLKYHDARRSAGVHVRDHPRISARHRPATQPRRAAERAAARNVEQPPKGSGPRGERDGRDDTL